MKLRTFIAVDIGAISELVDFENEISDSGINAKLVEPENIHITLKFLGNTNEELIPKIKEIIDESVNGINQFNLSFKGAGAFPNLNYIKILWIGIDDPGPLPDIAKKLDIALKPLGFNTEKRGFKPHITIGRVKSREGKGRLKKIILNSKDRSYGEIMVDKILLKRSVLTPSGPIYSTIVEAELKS